MPWSEYCRDAVQECLRVHVRVVLCKWNLCPVKVYVFKSASWGFSAKKIHTIQEYLENSQRYSVYFYRYHGGFLLYGLLLR